MLYLLLQVHLNLLLPTLYLLDLILHSGYAIPDQVYHLVIHYQEHLDEL